MDLSAIILAGGLGTRLRSVVADVPKPMAPIAGRPFLAYQIDYWINQGIKHFILSVGYKHETIMDYFGHQYRDAEIEYAIETTPLGTGGGFLQATQKLKNDSPFLLLNGDTYFAVDLQKLLQFFQMKNADWCFSLFRPQENGRYMGMDVAPTGEIIALKSESAQCDRLANGGVYLVHPRILSEHTFSLNDKVSIEDDIFPAALSSKQHMFGIEFQGSFIDIGIPADYQRSSDILTISSSS